MKTYQVTVIKEDITTYVFTREELVNINKEGELNLDIDNLSEEDMFELISNAQEDVLSVNITDGDVQSYCASIVEFD